MTKSHEQIIIELVSVKYETFDEFMETLFGLYTYIEDLETDEGYKYTILTKIIDNIVRENDLAIVDALNKHGYPALSFDFYEIEDPSETYSFTGPKGEYFRLSSAIVTDAYIKHYKTLNGKEILRRTLNEIVQEVNNSLNSID